MTRVAALIAVALAVMLLLAHPTDAALNARTEHLSSSFSTTSLYPPTAPAAVALGHDTVVSWTAGLNGSGYRVLGGPASSSAACASATLATVGSTTGLTYTDTGRYTPQGSWYCYEAQTSYGSSWTSTSSATVAVQLGAVLTSVTSTNGGTSAALDTGDTITLTFNQAIATASGPSGTNSVCATSASSPGATVVIGATATSGSCTAAEATNGVRLAGGGSSRNVRYSATYVWTSSNRVLTVTIGARTVGTNSSTISGSWVATPTTTATKLLTSTGSFHVCDTNTGGGTCTPTASGSI
jgi:hypothetical protein